MSSFPQQTHICNLQVSQWDYLTQAKVRCCDETYQQLGGCDGVVGVDAEFLGTEWHCLLQLGCQEHADGPQQLQVALLGGFHRQEAVHVVHRQREDLLLTLLLLTDLHTQTRHTAIQHRFLCSA